MARRWQNTSTPDDDTLLRDLAADQISRLTRKVEQDPTYKGSSANGEDAVLRPPVPTDPLWAGAGLRPTVGSVRGAGGEGRRGIPIPSVASGPAEGRSPLETGTAEADAQVARIHADEESILGYLARESTPHQAGEQNPLRTNRRRASSRQRRPPPR